MKTDLVSEGFVIDNCEIFSADEIRRTLFMSDESLPNFKRASIYLVNKYKNACDAIFTKLNEKYRQIYISLPKDDPVRKDVIKKSEELSNNIKKNGVKLLKNYLKKLEKSPLDLYFRFISSLGDLNISNFSDKEKYILQSQTLKDIKNKSFEFSDLPALLYINYLYTGKEFDYKNVVIDEAQDYGLFHFSVLKDIIPNSVFSIYGDLAQAIYSYRSISNWEEVKDKIFDSRAEIIHLNKSYRTTIEITNNANKVLDKLNQSVATPVVRHGSEVIFSNQSNNINYKVELINDWLEKQYKSIAIICKDEKEAKKVNIELQENGISSNYLCSNAIRYDGGVQVLTSASAKGLEFDAVILNDVSEEKYSSNNAVDMHLLYVASTRALHEQVILYSKNINKAYADCISGDDYSSEVVKVKKIR